MKYILCGLVLLATLGLAQQPRQVPPPESTPPTFPQEHTPGQQMPPDMEAPPATSTTQVQRQIEQDLNTAPALAGSNVDVKTDEQTVVLTGTVDTQEQHDVALRIAKSYAGERQIVDKIKLRQHA
jgi:hyperosmotically inducible protein